MATEVLEIQVNLTGADSANKELKDLKKTISELNKLNGTSLGKLTTKLDSLAKSLSSFPKDAVNNLNELARSLASLSAAATSDLSGISKGIASVVRTSDKITDESLERMARLANIMEQMGRVGDIPRVNINTSNTSQNVRETTERVHDLRNEIDRTGESARKAGNKADQSAGFWGKLVKSIARIAFYRAIRTAIKAITDAMNEGLTTVYEYSRTVNGNLYQSLNNISSASAKMTNQLGAAFGTLLETVTPILITIINWLTVAIEKITQFFAAIAGKSTYLKANNVTKEWAENTQAGAAAAEEWKNQLMGFDELNRLDSPSSGGSGGGSGTDFGSMFSEAPLEDWALKLKDIVANVKEVMGAFFGKLKNWFDGLRADVSNAAETVWNFFEKLKNGATSSLPSLSELFGKLHDWLKGTETEVASTATVISSKEYETEGILDRLSSKYSEWWSNSYSSTVRGTGIVTQKIDNAFGKIDSLVFSAVTSYLSISVSLWDGIVSTCKSGISSAGNNIMSFVSGTVTSFVAWANTVGSLASQAFYSVANSVYGGLRSAWGNVTSFVTGTYDAFCAWGNGVINLIGQTVAGVIEDIANMAVSAWGWIKSLASKVGASISGFVANNSGTLIKVGLVAGGIAAAGLAISLAAPTLGTSLAGLGGLAAAIPVMAFASGGFPEDGLFMANSGELVGQFSNGRTAVANNEQILIGIRQGVYEATMAAITNGNLPTATDVRESKSEFYLDGKMIRNSLNTYQRAAGV